MFDFLMRLTGRMGMLGAKRRDRRHHHRQVPLGTSWALLGLAMRPDGCLVYAKNCRRTPSTILGNEDSEEQHLFRRLHKMRDR